MGQVASRLGAASRRSGGGAAVKATQDVGAASVGRTQGPSVPVTRDTASSASTLSSEVNQQVGNLVSEGMAIQSRDWNSAQRVRPTDGEIADQPFMRHADLYVPEDRLQDSDAMKPDTLALEDLQSLFVAARDLRKPAPDLASEFGLSEPAVSRLLNVYTLPDVNHDASMNREPMARWPDNRELEWDAELERAIEEERAARRRQRQERRVSEVSE